MRYIFAITLVAIVYLGTPTDVFIVGILGQSGAAGYSICPDELPNVPDGIYNFGNDYQLRPAQEPIDIGTNQVDQISYDSISRCGPALSLAIRLKKETGKNIILVPCAKGGSFSIQWLPSTSRDTLYGSCLHRLQTINPNNVHRTVIFFFQGESDARQLDSALTWDDKFISIATGLKADLNNPPIVFVQLSKNPNVAYYPYFEQVKTEQANINLPNVVMVKSDDLALDASGHLSYDSSLVVGIRAANAVYQLLRRRPVSVW